MADLKTPLREHLEDGFDEADVHRTWRGVQRQLARREVDESRHALWGIAFGGAIAALLVIVWLAQGRTSSAGPLRLAAGPLPNELATVGAVEPAPADLSDGSRVILGPNSHLEVLENGGGAFVTALRRGRSTFEVKPGGPRRWIIECGLATVEVVGTAFSIERETNKLDVTVDRGVVVVRGENVPDRVQRLVAGERLEVRDTTHAEDAEPDPDASVDPAPPTSSLPVPIPVLPAPAPAPVLSAPAPAPAPAPSSSSAPDLLDTMLREADQAQRSGDKRRAADVLHRVVQQAPGDPRASFAAFTLARLTMDDDPRAAASSLSALLQAGVPRGLEEDARARLVEAHARAGEHERALDAAAEYERRFPNGSRLSEVHRWAHH